MSAALETIDEVAFDEETHTYRRGAVTLTSVTTVIDSCWPRKDGASDDAIENARKRGVAIDGWMTTWLAGNDIHIPAGIDQQWKSSFKMAAEWWNANRGGKIAQTQARLFGKTEAGTMDIFILDGSEIIDLKSTHDVSKQSTAQLGGYRALVKECWGIDVQKLGILHAHYRLTKGAAYHAVDPEVASKQWNTVLDFYRLTTPVKRVKK